MPTQRPPRPPAGTHHINPLYAAVLVGGWEVNARRQSINRINTEFTADMAELNRVRVAPVCHHPVELAQPCLGKEQPWQALAGVKPHQSAFQKASGDGRELRLASLRAAAPTLELEALGHGR